MLVMLGVLLAVWLSHEGRNKSDKATKLAASDDLQTAIKAAEAVARSFLAEADPAKRLQWVRNEREVRQHMAGYSQEAREAPGEIEKMIGHGGGGRHAVTAFAVAMPSGNKRLLEVVATQDGPKVDWDAYARHGAASWEDLWSGKARRAVVRVFCEPATERPEPFEDQSKWTCFRMSGPDMPQVALGFAPVGSVREKMMRQVVLGSPNYRQRFTLEIVRHEGEDEPLFEIVMCHAVGWIMGESPVEQDWELVR
jgi:hypothetical protein